MTDVSQLESRISAAFDRIDKALAGLASAQTATSDSGEVAALQEQLEAERTANQQLEQRVLAIKEKQETIETRLKGEVEKLREQLEQREATVQKIKKVNHRLRENNRALREANRQAVGNPELINDAMGAELDALRLSREEDRAELDAILGELKPLVEGAANA